MRILGLNLEEYCSAALMVDGEIVAAVTEERFTRRKCYSGFPLHSIQYCLEVAGTSIDQIDLVAVADLGISAHGIDVSYIQRRSNFGVKEYVKEAHEYWYPLLYEKKQIDYVDVFKDMIDMSVFPEEFNDYYWKHRSEYPDGDIPAVQSLKRRLIRTYFPEIPEEKILFMPHHECHAFYGYFTSPFVDREDTLVVTLDSWGDFENGTVSRFREGKYTLLHTIDNQNLGRLFRNLTLLLGLKPYEHEYKVMGLAPYAPAYLAESAYEVIARSMYVDGINFSYHEEPTDHYFWFQKRLEGIRFDGIAGGLQKFFEEKSQEWFKNLVREFKTNRVVFSGGLAMNIKANMGLSQLEEISDFFVGPSPDDNSNCIAACYLAMYRHLESRGEDPAGKIKPLKNAYLGPDISDEKVKGLVQGKPVKIYENVTPGFVAERLAEGAIIGRCAGRMEFGARALGNRSILADPRDVMAVNRINRIIKKRDFWMPFAPVVIDEDWDRYLVRSKPLFSPYMTVGFDTTGEARKNIPATLHMSDFSTRPQMLVRETNPDYYDIVKAFKDKTGIGSLMNTSFNLHGFPIVCSEADAIEVLENSDLDALLFKNIYVEKIRD